jgi:SET domain-containing protein
MDIPAEIKHVSGKDLGLFASRDIEPGEIIEACPVIPLTKQERQELENTILDHYIYPWHSEEDACMVLGHGSLINHAYDSNADWQPDLENNLMNYRAVKAIKTGEEITVNYNGHPQDATPIDWFVVK